MKSASPTALDTMNPPLHSLSGKRLDAAHRSAAMNWNHVDDVPTPVLNQILWWDNRGYDQALPVSRTSSLSEEKAVRMLHAAK
jgi:hypothetical protein